MNERIKSPAYLKHIRSLPCLVCERPGVDPHHLMHAEPSAMSMRSGDNWAVPLCRHHHDALHGFGAEPTWWAVKGIDPDEWAIKSWNDWSGWND